MIYEYCSLLGEDLRYLENFNPTANNTKTSATYQILA